MVLTNYWGDLIGPFIVEGSKLKSELYEALPFSRKLFGVYEIQGWDTKGKWKMSMHQQKSNFNSRLVLIPIG